MSKPGKKESLPAELAKRRRAAAHEEGQEPNQNVIGLQEGKMIADESSIDLNEKESRIAVKTKEADKIIVKDGLIEKIEKIHPLAAQQNKLYQSALILTEGMRKIPNRDTDNNAQWQANIDEFKLLKKEIKRISSLMEKLLEGADKVLLVTMSKQTNISATEEVIAQYNQLIATLDEAKEISTFKIRALERKIPKPVPAVEIKALDLEDIVKTAILLATIPPENQVEYLQDLVGPKRLQEIANNPNSWNAILAKLDQKTREIFLAASSSMIALPNLPSRIAVKARLEEYNGVIMVYFSNPGKKGQNDSERNNENIIFRKKLELLREALSRSKKWEVEKMLGDSPISNETILCIQSKEKNKLTIKDDNATIYKKLSKYAGNVGGLQIEFYVPRRPDAPKPSTVSPLTKSLIGRRLKGQAVRLFNQLPSSDTDESKNELALSPQPPLTDKSSPLLENEAKLKTPHRPMVAKSSAAYKRYTIFNRPSLESSLHEEKEKANLEGKTHLDKEQDPPVAKK